MSDGIEKLLYGLKIKWFSSPSEIVPCMFYINHKNTKLINFVEPGVRRVYEVSLANITTLNFGKNNGNFIAKPENSEAKKIPEGRCMTIRLSKDFYDLIFDNENDLLLFIAGIMAFFTDTYLEKDKEE